MARSPNILFFFVDQQRWDTCGCYGQPLPITPQLDAMAAQGTRFAHAFSCQPVCGPCRAALMSGRYPTAVDCPTNHCRLPAGTDTIATHCAAAGYQTAYIGKWHLASTGEMGGPDDFRTQPVPPDRRGGFKDFWLASDVLEFTSHGYDGHMFAADGTRREFPAGRYRADAQTDWLIEWLETQRDPERPFLTVCSYIEPHHQNDHECYEGPHGSKERWQDFVPPADLPPGVGDWEREYPDYLGCCHALDANLGRVRQALQRLDLTEDTIIVYASDHGSHFCTRNGEYKRSCHDSSIRVPFVVTGPGFSGGRVVDAPISLIDLPATILRAAGVDQPDGWHGRPLQDLVAGDPDWSEDCFVQISESCCGRALRSRRWTYSVEAPRVGEGWDRRAAAERYVETELYDNEADPHQQTNLIADPAHAGTRADCRRRLLAAIGRYEGASPIIDEA